VTIRITVWIQGLFSGFVIIAIYGKWYQPTALRDAAVLGISGIIVPTMTSLRHRPLAEVCTVPVCLVSVLFFRKCLSLEFSVSACHFDNIFKRENVDKIKNL